ncbi:MAG: 23S rRNA (guanosine(2251)-2'-O)-methyltransferase RlmB [Azospirillum sp.]|nr:23S rRNA (guanosine(2251)-2'-O)-methyltransferase RlmB [Azospirillum sp.]
MPSKNTVTIYGRHAVLAALSNPHRRISKVMCIKENINEIKGKIADNKITIVERRELDKILSAEAVHQGFAAIAEILPGIDVEDICSLAEEKENCYLLVLDQVTDPQNIGAIIRSCAAFGSLALMVQDKNSPQESGAMLKAAAGTFENMPVCRVTNLSRALEQLKKAGFWIVGMDGYAQTNIDKLNKKGKLAVVMGSEGKGMRRLIEESCDITVRLPIAEGVESLNVSTAAAVVLYELSK